MPQGAFRTKPSKFKAMPDDGKYGGTVQFIFDFLQRRKRRIIHPAAFHASTMIMFARIPIESWGVPSKFEFLDLPQFGQDFQVSIDCSKADPGEMHPDRI